MAPRTSPVPVRVTEALFTLATTALMIPPVGSRRLCQPLPLWISRTPRIIRSRVGNYAHPKHPAFQDFGDCMIECDNGVTGYFRVDWFTPDGMGAWGDGRTLITGTDGMIEIRKYIDLANSAEGDHVYFADRAGEHHLCVSGQCGFPFFGSFALIDPSFARSAVLMENTMSFVAKRIGVSGWPHPAAPIIRYASSPRRFASFSANFALGSQPGFCTLPP